jgi:N-acyl-phosphatidylethanolamine-hydrolysing phospholipase D
VRSLSARLVLATSLLALLLVGGCAGVGGPKPGAPAHHRERGFANTSPGDPRPGLWTRARFFASRIVASTFAPRTADFPLVPNDGRALRERAGGPTVTWVGHATLLIQLDGVNVLTDPQWSERASPLSFGGPKRVMPPGLAFENLPPIHAVVISHDHYDHLDVATVRQLAATHRPRFFVPLRMKAWFADIGISEQVEELDWWDARGVGTVTLTLVPSHHWSQRTPWDTNRRLWGGWVVAGRERRLYFAGDTAYFDGFKEIGARLGPIDVAALPIGAYLPPVIMKPGHLDPAQALDAFVDLRARTLLAIHFGTFDLAEEPLEEPPRLLERLADERKLTERVWILKHGETRAW